MRSQRSLTPTVLVIESEVDLAELLGLWFGNLGWHVVTARSGPEGLATTIAVDPDVVILDVVLPGFNGPELLRRLRSAGSTTPVILTTAIDEFDCDHAAGAAALAQAVLSKPYSLAGLQSQVRALCGIDVR